VSIPKKHGIVITHHNSQVYSPELWAQERTVPTKASSMARDMGGTRILT